MDVALRNEHLIVDLLDESIVGALLLLGKLVLTAIQAFL